MGAFVKHKFSKGFFLDEERIRKLHDLLENRAEQLEIASRPLYKIYRADAFTYDTEDIEDILHEDNAEWQRITRLVVSLEPEKGIFLQLDFDEKATNLQIEGDIRDDVFLVFSDLKQYLTNEVCTRRSPFSSKKVAQLLFALPVTLLFAWIYIRGSVTKVDVVDISAESVLKSQDLAAKLNYLIVQQSKSEVTTIPVAIGSVFLVASLGLAVFGEAIILKPLRYLHPRNIFLVGKEIERHERRIKLRDRLIWTIGVGLIMTILGVVLPLIF